MEANKMFVRSVIIAIVFWIVAALRSAVLVEDQGFIASLYSGPAWDMILRAVFVILLLFVGRKLQTFAVELQDTQEKASADQQNATTCVQQLGAGTLILDSKGQIRKSNEWLRTVVGHSSSDLVQRSFVDVLVAPGYQDKASQLLSDLKSQGRGDALATRLLGADGKLVPVLLSVAPYQSHDMEEAGALVVVQDNRKTQRALDKLQKTMDGLKQAVEAAVVPTAVINHDLELVYANSAFTPGDAEESWLAASFGSEQLHCLEQGLRSALDEESVAQVPFEADGIEYLAVLLPFNDGNGNQLVLWTSTDVTSLKGQMGDLEQQLQAVQTELEERRRDVEDLEEQINQMNREKANMEQERDRLSNTLEQTESEVRVLQQREDNMEEEIRSLKDQLEQAHQHGDGLEQERQQLQGRIADLEESIQSNRSQLDRLEDKLASWRRLVEQMTLPAAVIDASGQLVQASGGLQKLLGAAAEEIGSQGLLSYLLHDKDKERHSEDFEAALQGEAVPVRLVDIGGAEDTVVTAAVSLQRQQEAGEEPLVLAVAQPVTELRSDRDAWRDKAKGHKLEVENLLEEIEAERDRFHGVIQGVDDGVILTDVYHRVIQMNRAAEDMLNVRLSEVLERPVRFALEGPQLTDELERTLSENLKRHEFTIEPHTSGLEMNLSMAASLVRNKGGRAICVVTRIRPA